MITLQGKSQDHVTPVDDVSPVHHVISVDHVTSVDYVDESPKPSQPHPPISIVISKAREKRRRTKQQQV